MTLDSRSIAINIDVPVRKAWFSGLSPDGVSIEIREFIGLKWDRHRWRRLVGVRDRPAIALIQGNYSRVERTRVCCSDTVDIKINRCDIGQIPPRLSQLLHLIAGNKINQAIKYPGIGSTTIIRQCKWNSTDTCKIAEVISNSNCRRRLTSCIYIDGSLSSRIKNRIAIDRCLSAGDKAILNRIRGAANNKTTIVLRINLQISGQIKPAINHINCVGRAHELIIEDSCRAIRNCIFNNLDRSWDHNHS